MGNVRRVQRKIERGLAELDKYDSEEYMDREQERRVETQIMIGTMMQQLEVREREVEEEMNGYSKREDKGIEEPQMKWMWKDITTE